VARKIQEPIEERATSPARWHLPRWHLPRWWHVLLAVWLILALLAPLMRKPPIIFGMLFGYSLMITLAGKVWFLFQIVRTSVGNAQSPPRSLGEAFRRSVRGTRESTILMAAGIGLVVLASVYGLVLMSLGLINL